MKTVVVDVDGVLANWVGAFCQFAPPSGARYEGHDGPDVYAAHDWPGWTRHDEDAIWGRIHGTPNWFFTLDAIDATRENVWALIRMTEETNLYIVTARRQHAGKPMHELTQHWIEEHFSAHTSVIATGSQEKKLAVVKALDPDFVIDDTPGMLKMYGKEGIRGVTVRDWKYNRGVLWPYRVRSLAEFAKLVGVSLE